MKGLGHLQSPSPEMFGEMVTLRMLQALMATYEPSPEQSWLSPAPSIKPAKASLALSSLLMVYCAKMPLAE